MNNNIKLLVENIFDDMSNNLDNIYSIFRPVLTIFNCKTENEIFEYFFNKTTLSLDIFNLLNIILELTLFEVSKSYNNLHINELDNLRDNLQNKFQNDTNITVYDGIGLISLIYKLPQYNKPHDFNITLEPKVKLLMYISERYVNYCNLKIFCPDCINYKLTDLNTVIIPTLPRIKTVLKKLIENFNSNKENLYKEIINKIIKPLFNYLYGIDGIVKETTSKPHVYPVTEKNIEIMRKHFHRGTISVFDRISKPGRLVTCLSALLNYNSNKTKLENIYNEEILICIYGKCIKYNLMTGNYAKYILDALSYLKKMPVTYKDVIASCDPEYKKQLDNY